MHVYVAVSQSTVTVLPPFGLYSHYEVTSILQLYDVTNIIYVDSYIITTCTHVTPVQDTANMLCTDSLALICFIYAII